jgi:hypothetical protein
MDDQMDQGDWSHRYSASVLRHDLTSRPLSHLTPIFRNMDAVSANPRGQRRIMSSVIALSPS